MEIRIEIWKDIPQFEGFYQISNFGNVKSVEKSVKGKGNCVRILPSIMLKPRLTVKGYLRVNLNKFRTVKYCVIHRLVAENFITNPENKSQVNHIDGDKLNNNDWNLEWNTASENTNHAVKNGLRNTKGINNINSVINEQIAKEIKELLLTHRIIDIAKKFNISWDIVNSIKINRTWKYV